MGNTSIKSLVTDSQVPNTLYNFISIFFSLFYRLVIYIHLHSSLPIFSSYSASLWLSPPVILFPSFIFFQFVLVSLFAEILIFQFILRMEKVEFSVAFWTVCIRASLKASVDISTNFAIVPLASVGYLFPCKLRVFWFFVC